jgi:hypothetical protein
MSFDHLAVPNLVSGHRAMKLLAGELWHRRPSWTRFGCAQLAKAISRTSATTPSQPQLSETYHRSEPHLPHSKVELLNPLTPPLTSTSSCFHFFLFL